MTIAEIAQFKCYSSLSSYNDSLEKNKMFNQKVHEVQSCVGKAGGLKWDQQKTYFWLQYIAFATLKSCYSSL